MFPSHDWTVIQSRRQTGSVRECHGDLHARNIVRWRQHGDVRLPGIRSELRWIDVIMMRPSFSWIGFPRA